MAWNGIRPEPVRDRIIKNVQITESGCWIWTRGVGRNGYGRIKLRRPRPHTALAHRAAYEAFVGPIPEGLQLDHLCRVRACVRPSHLEPVTARANVLRGDTVTARNARRTRCVHGHPFDEANTLRTSRGTRQCRTCSNTRRAKLRRPR